MPIIPPRSTVVTQVLPKLDDPSVNREQADKIVAALEAKIVAALADPNGEVVVDVGLSALELERLLFKADAWNSHSLSKVSGDTLRAVMGAVVNELVQAGYYNIVYQVLNHLDSSGYKDGLQLRFAIAGKKSYDVDFETSAMLSADNEAFHAKSGPWSEADRAHWLGSVNAEKRWDEFVNGQKRILRNQNGMDPNG